VRTIQNIKFWFRLWASDIPTPVP